MSIVNALRDFLVSPFDAESTNLYGACIQAARQPAFYAQYDVPDTVDGRFDLLLLHVVLVMLRIQDETLRQRLFDIMFVDMERSLREMGVGDMGIGRKMKPMLQGFYGRAESYKAALAGQDDEALITALSRNLYGMPMGTAAHAAKIASYVRQSVTLLAEVGEDDLAAGHISFASIAG